MSNSAYFVKSYNKELKKTIKTMNSAATCGQILNYFNVKLSSI